MRRRWSALLAAPVLTAALLAAPAEAETVITFADEDRGAELTGEVPHQRYQFNTPTTVTTDRDSVTGDPADARVYVADMGNHIIRVHDMDGRAIGALDDGDTALAPDSPAASVPEIAAPIGLYFLSKGEAADDRLAGLYVNDAGLHRLHFFRTDPADPGAFQYVTSFGQEGTGGGDDLKLPRNMAVTPGGLLYVSDEFNHRVKGFRIDPVTWGLTPVATVGSKGGPILPGQDKDYGTDSTHYDDYAGQPLKRDGFRIPQGMTYWRSPDGSRTYLYVCDQGNNRIKVFEVAADGGLALVDILGRFTVDGGAEHLKRPRGVRTDRAGNLYVADTYAGRIVRFPNLGTNTASYRTSLSSDAAASWAYGRLGIHQVEIRLPATKLTEDQAFQLPNDVVPVEKPDGTRVTEDIWAWGTFYADARVLLVSDAGNHRIKKCWEHPTRQEILRCSVSAGVGGTADHEFWGHPRTLAGQLHAAGALDVLPGSTDTLLVSDTPNTVVYKYGLDGTYQGEFADVSYGVTGLSVFGGQVAVLVAADAALPWPYTGDSSLRVYDSSGNQQHVFNLSYRTSGASDISFTGGNYPQAVDVDGSAVYITASGGYLYRFNLSGSLLSLDWVKGGPDPAKGTDDAPGPNFYGEGADGTFDQIQDVTAGGGRVYAVDRRNQRVQVFNASSGAYIGKIGQGGGTYDHPDAITADELFLPVGVSLDAGGLLIGDGFNMVARSYADPTTVNPDANGQIKPAFLDHWVDPHLGTRPGGLFATQHVVRSGSSVFVDSLISNRITRIQ
ncbi:NHL repeat-containing protein [Spirillospora sp. NPDC048819]|uniref:NHL repeat-containing protein n=1 Tax=Spirillospora sp. NPDC048819 TaxID=3155268 RepID=UPI0033D1043E